MVTYIINFFTSEEDKGAYIALQSSKLSIEDIFKTEFVTKLNRLVGNGDKSPEGIFVFQIIERWKEVFIKFIKDASKTIPELQSVIALVSKMEEGKCLGVLLNCSIDAIETKKLMLEMKELESGTSTKEQLKDFLNNYSALFEHYRLLNYPYNKIVRFGEQRRELRTCRYCGCSMSDNATFKTDAHTISNCLGNIAYFTNDECDECNKKFGATIEQEFLKYISFSRVISSQFEGFKSYKIKTDSFELSVNPDTNDVEFKLIDYTKASVIRDKTGLVLDVGSIDFSDVYRAIVKFVIGMLPTSELKHFKKTIDWINKDCVITLPNIKETIHKEPVVHPFINMYFRKKNEDPLPYLCADLHILHYEFIFMIPGCELDNQILSSTIIDEFLKLYKKDAIWNDIQLNNKQSARLLLHISLEKGETPKLGKYPYNRIKKKIIMTGNDHDRK